MVGLCATSNIVRLDWLLDSAKHRRALPCKGYLILDDREAEEQYNFSMRKTIERGNEVRSQGKTLLEGFSVHLCVGVAGNKSKTNKTPPIKEFKLIISSTGASWISSLPDSGKGNNNEDFSNIIIVSSKIAREADKQLAVKRIAEAVARGARTLTTEDFFRGIMNQKFQF